MITDSRYGNWSMHSISPPLIIIAIGFLSYSSIPYPLAVNFVFGMLSVSSKSSGTYQTLCTLTTSEALTISFVANADMVLILSCPASLSFHDSATMYITTF